MSDGSSKLPGSLTFFLCLMALGVAALAILDDKIIVGVCCMLAVGTVIGITDTEKD